MTWNLTVSYYGVNSLLLRVKRFYLVHIIVRQILELSISNCFVNLSLLLITNSIRYLWLLISICPTLIGLTKYVFPQRLSIGMFVNYILSDVCLTQVNNYPTRNSILDLLLTTVPDLLIDDLCSYQDVVDSDRNCLSFKIGLSSNDSRPVLRSF